MKKAIKKGAGTAAKKTATKKVARKKKATTVKVGARKAARKAGKKKVVRKKRKAVRKVRKVTKTGKKRGRPPLKKKPGRPPLKKKAGRKKKPGRKPGPKPGRKPGPKPRAATASLINLPINNQTDVNFWSNLVAFLNQNKNKSFIIQLDGTSFRLGVQ